MLQEAGAIRNVRCGVRCRIVLACESDATRANPPPGLVTGAYTDFRCGLAKFAAASLLAIDIRIPSHRPLPCAASSRTSRPYSRPTATDIKVCWDTAI